MDGPAAHGRHEQVADLLDGEAAFDGGAIALGQLHGVGTAQEVGSVEQVDVQGVALYPLSAVEKAAKIGHLPAHLHTEGVLHRRAGAHLVRHGADAADAGRDVGGLGGPASLQERLEEAGRLEDVERHLPDHAVAHLHVERTLALHAREPLYRHRALRVPTRGSSPFRTIFGRDGLCALGQRPGLLTEHRVARVEGGEQA